MPSGAQVSLGRQAESLQPFFTIFGHLFHFPPAIPFFLRQALESVGGWDRRTSRIVMRGTLRPFGSRTYFGHWLRAVAGDSRAAGRSIVQNEPVRGLLSTAFSTGLLHVISDGFGHPDTAMGPHRLTASRPARQPLPIGLPVRPAASALARTSSWVARTRT